jgi:hypothetical protein
MRLNASPHQASTGAAAAVASARRQRAPWSGVSITSSGMALRQRSSPKLQRSAKTQPAGSADRFGGAPD